MFFATRRSFQTAAVLNAAHRPARKPTKLAASLKPSRGRLEVAPAFDRSQPPHLTRSRAPAPPQQTRVSQPERPRSANVEGVEEVEFFQPTDRVSVAGSDVPCLANDSLPSTFSSPPLLPGLVTSVHEMLGPEARPTMIQRLSMRWILDQPHASTPDAADIAQERWKRYLLASETGSGKSIAYLLPVLQHLKQSEASAPPPQSSKLYNPRALILAPTHELARQLAGFAKSLLYHSKLRVVCTSKANVFNQTRTRDTPTQGLDVQSEGFGEFEVTPENSHASFSKGTQTHQGQSVDAVVGTPIKLLEMVRGRGWDRVDVSQQDAESEGERNHLRRGRDKIPLSAPVKWKSSHAELGLENVEWVVVDEADILFDPDFQETTHTLLADISAARGKRVGLLVSPLLSQQSIPPTSKLPPVEPIEYPFHLVLTTATIPNTLNTYLQVHHPTLLRLASPNVHRLPKTLKTEYASWSGGNKFPDVERRIRQVWAEDDAARRAAAPSTTNPTSLTQPGLSKVLIFCNRNTKVTSLAEHLGSKGIKSVALTSKGEVRARGSNKHLDGFMRVLGTDRKATKNAQTPTKPDDVSTTPHVLITTSLLSRGLDFSPDIKHVLIVDEPRNMVDFLHRAGRAGRAGFKGTVVIFGKTKGRGSDRTKQVMRKVGSLRK